MFLSRASLISMAALAGTALGATAWLVAGRQDAFALSQDRLAGLGAFAAGAGGTAASAPMGPPLFSLSTGPHAVTDPVVALLGVSRMPGRTAALLSINGQPGLWLTLGESREQVILREVGGGRAKLDLPLGLQDLRIGESTRPLQSLGVAASAGPSPGLGLMPADDGPPPGFRLPPPPASAPGVGG